MSTNCVCCATTHRTGPDLLCNDCRDSRRIVQALQILRHDTAVTIEILNPNDDFNGQPNEAVEVNAEWTDWTNKRFTGDTLQAALDAAVMAKIGADAKARKQKGNTP